MPKAPPPIYFEAGNFRRLRLFHQLEIVMYLRTDKALEYTKPKLKEIYFGFYDAQYKAGNCCYTANGIVCFNYEGTAINVAIKKEVRGFFHIPDCVRNNTTAGAIAKLTEKIFAMEFGLFYSDSLCPDEAKLADYSYDCDGLVIKPKAEIAEEVKEEDAHEKNNQQQQKKKKTTDESYV